MCRNFHTFHNVLGVTVVATDIRLVGDLSACDALQERGDSPSELAAKILLHDVS